MKELALMLAAGAGLGYLGYRVLKAQAARATPASPARTHAIIIDSALLPNRGRVSAPETGDTEGFSIPAGAFQELDDLLQV